MYTTCYNIIIRMTRRAEYEMARGSTDFPESICEV